MTQSADRRLVTESRLPELTTEALQSGPAKDALNAAVEDMGLPVGPYPALRYAEDLATTPVDGGVLLIGHRGGRGYGPEETLETFRRTVGMGIRGLEMDVRTTSDGVPVLMHDSTVDRTTNGTGNLADKTWAQMQELRIDASTWFSNTSPDTAVVLFEDVLREFGNRVMLFPEMNMSGGGNPVVPAVLDLLHKYKINPDTIRLQVGGAGLAAEVLAGGYKPMWIGAIAPHMTPATVSNNGVDWVACSISDVDLDEDYVTACHDAGIKVCVYGVEAVTEYALVAGYGVDAIMSSDPLWVSGRAPVYRRDRFHELAPIPGFRGPQLFTEFFQGGWAGWEGSPTGNPYTVSYVQPTDPSNFTLTVTLKMTAVSAATGFGGIWIGAIDRPFTNSAHVNNHGYHFLIRQNGALEVYYFAPSTAAVSLGSLPASSGTDVVLGAEVPLKITVTPTTLRFERVDLPAEFVEVADSTVRGRFPGIVRGSAAVRFRDLVVT